MRLFNLSVSLVGVGFAVSVLGQTAAAGDAALKYHFDGINHAIYRIVVSTDLPDRTQQTTAYVNYTPAFEGDQIKVPYRMALQTVTAVQDGKAPVFDPPITLFDPPDAQGRLAIDSAGKPVAGVERRDGWLPGTTMSCWTLPLPQLSASGETSWTVSQPITLHEAQPQPSWPPRPMFFVRQPSETLLAAHRTIHYTAGSITGGMATVHYALELTTDTPGENGLAEHDTGTGSFQFDTDHGLLRSLDSTLTVEASMHNVTARVPTTIHAELLLPEQIAALKEAATAKAAKDAAARAQFEKEHQYDTDTLPAGTEETPLVGGTGGGAFIKASPDQRPLLGLELSLGSWDGHRMIGSVQPLFDPPADLHPAGKSVIFAKDGYAVGGLWMNGTDQANALRVIFMKRTDTGLDPKQVYMSPWYGQLVGPERIKLAGKGERVVGVYGRQGLNTDALGLVTAAGTGSDPTDDPNYAGTPAPKGN